MPKLYYTPISCGGASFIAAFTAKVQLKCEQVDLHSKEGKITAGGVDYCSINPKGNVPCLVLDDGTVLNENIAVLLFIADQVTNSTTLLTFS
jgi:glutathione S-transferase